MARFAWIFAACLLASPVVAGDMADDALALINQHREAAGCGPLKMQSQLLAAAKAHASAMATQNFFGHSGKGGSSNRRIRAQGYEGRLTGENIAAGQKSAAEAVKSWIDSPPHRRNMLTCAYTETGLAVVYQADDQAFKGNSGALHYYWVQDFGRQ